MEFTTKRLDTEKNKHFWAMDTSLNVTLGFTLNSNEANNAILKKVIENYEHDFQISPEGHYVVVLDRKIETSIDIENDFFSGGTFLIGETVREVQKTKKIKTQVSPSFLIYKTLKSYAMPFLNWRRFINDSRILDI